MKCPDCGREQATSLQDCANGLCPKWWAIRDPDAEIDCARHAYSSISLGDLLFVSQTVGETRTLLGLAQEVCKQAQQFERAAKFRDALAVLEHHRDQTLMIETIRTEILP